MSIDLNQTTGVIANLAIITFVVTSFLGGSTEPTFVVGDVPNIALEDQETRIRELEGLMADAGLPKKEVKEPAKIHSCLLDKHTPEEIEEFYSSVTHVPEAWPELIAQQVEDIYPVVSYDDQPRALTINGPFVANEPNPPSFSDLVAFAKVMQVRGQDFSNRIEFLENNL